MVINVGMYFVFFLGNQEVAEAPADMKCLVAFVLDLTASYRFLECKDSKESNARNYTTKRFLLLNIP